MAANPYDPTKPQMMRGTSPLQPPVGANQQPFQLPGQVQTDPANDAATDSVGGNMAKPLTVSNGAYGTPYTYGNAGSAPYRDVGDMQLGAPNSNVLQVPGSTYNPNPDPKTPEEWNKWEQDFAANFRSLQDLSPNAPHPELSSGVPPDFSNPQMSKPSYAAAGAAGAYPAPPNPNPGVSIGGQQAYRDGPVVATSRVGFGDLPNPDTDFAGAAQRGADAAYKGATQYFDKDFGQQRADLETQLQAQGFAKGSEGFTRELDRMERGQNSARENAAFAAQGIGHQQAGDLLSRALASRAQLVGERSQDADRTYNQSLGIAGLGLGARGQDVGLQGTQAGASASMSNAGTAASANQYSTDVNANLALRRLGLDENNQGFGQLMQLIASSRGGVNMPNFGAPTPLDVTGANSIASGNANSSANRDAMDRTALYQLGGAALGSYFGK